MRNLCLSPSRLPKYGSSHHRSLYFLLVKGLTARYYVSTEISYVLYREEWGFREEERKYRSIEREENRNIGLFITLI